MVNGKKKKSKKIIEGTGNFFAPRTCHPEARRAEGSKTSDSSAPLGPQNDELGEKKNFLPRQIIIREEYCMGCRLCEVHCIVQHSKTKNIIKAYKGEYPKPLARIVVEESGYESFALQCRNCEDAPCLEACMTGAMHKDKDTGAVLCDEDKCVACWMCIMVCPFGVISRNIEGKKIASKCDLCKDEDIPVCVENCPNEAIICEEKV